jgi:hypothetical protein
MRGLACRNSRDQSTSEEDSPAGVYRQCAALWWCCNEQFPLSSGTASFQMGGRSHGLRGLNFT